MFLWSKFFIPTLRENPSEVENIGQRFLLRAGYIRRDGAGSFAFLPLARRALRKIVQVIRNQMDSASAQEFHVEQISPLKFARELRSYKQFPQVWYQFQTELESYSIDLTSEDREKAFRLHEKIFGEVLNRCGVKFSLPNEFDPPGNLEPEEFSTPNVKTIAEVAAFTGLPETSQIKTLALTADGKQVMILMRGDRQLDETKLRTAAGATEIRPARPDEVREWFGADAGSLGPVGVKDISILADEALLGRRNMICGANKNDFHLRYVTPGEDFAAEFADLARQDEPEFFHGSRLSSKGFDLPMELWLGRHTLSLQRILFAAAEQHHDADGLILPRSIAPFDAVITPVFYADEAQRLAAAEICAATEKAGLEVLLDDRDERPGVKFKDADLIGLPYRINIGKKLAQGLVEMLERSTKRVTDVATASILANPVLFFGSC